MKKYWLLLCLCYARAEDAEIALYGVEIYNDFLENIKAMSSINHNDSKDVDYNKHPPKFYQITIDGTNYIVAVPFAWNIDQTDEKAKIQHQELYEQLIKKRIEWAKEMDKHKTTLKFIRQQFYANSLITFDLTNLRLKGIGETKSDGDFNYEHKDCYYHCILDILLNFAPNETLSIQPFGTVKYVTKEGSSPTLVPLVSDLLEKWDTYTKIARAIIGQYEQKRIDVT